MSKPTVIVLVCVKDDAWILPRFLETCSRFADAIVVIDESTGFDETRSIYKNYPKVILKCIDGKEIRFDIKRKMALDEARKIPAERRILIGLDADEIISADVLVSPEWQTVLEAPPRTLFSMQWVTLWRQTELHVKPEIRDDYIFGEHGGYFRHIYVDDGLSPLPETGRCGLHCDYVPFDADRFVFLNDIVCLHYNYCNWPKFEAKQRLYRVLEKCESKLLTDWQIQSLYVVNYGIKFELAQSNPRWFTGWQDLGIDMTSCRLEKFTTADLRVIRCIREHGTQLFANLDIWSMDWNAIIEMAVKKGMLEPGMSITRPPRTFGYKILSRYMTASKHSKILKCINKLVGWESY